MKKLLLAIAICISVLCSCDCLPCKEKSGGSAVIDDGNTLIEIPSYSLYELQHNITVREPSKMIVIDSCEYMSIYYSGNSHLVPKMNSEFIEQMYKELFKEAVREVLIEEGLIEKRTPEFYSSEY